MKTVCHVPLLMSTLTGWSFFNNFLLDHYALGDLLLSLLCHHVELIVSALLQILICKGQLLHGTRFFHHPGSPAQRSVYRIGGCSGNLFPCERNTALRHLFLPDPQVIPSRDLCHRTQGPVPLRHRTSPYPGISGNDFYSFILSPYYRPMCFPAISASERSQRAGSNCRFRLCAPLPLQQHFPMPYPFLHNQQDREYRTSLYRVPELQ